MMRKIFIEDYDSPVGRLVLGAIDGRLCLCDWADAGHALVMRRLRRLLKAEVSNADVAPKDCRQVLERSRRQLCEYFDRRRTVFDVPLLPVGTDWQLMAWSVLAQVPYGQTVSYAEFAAMMTPPTCARAAAGACRANAISIFIPCHRVLAQGGAIGGYAGGLDAKRALLLLERQAQASAMPQLPLC